MRGRGRMEEGEGKEGGWMRGGEGWMRGRGRMDEREERMDEGEGKDG